MDATSIQVANEEKALGSWPRRLLHVPTLTSYEWQQGARYGKTVKPTYNILTYTWGRWKLVDTPTKQNATVKAIPVKGVSWNIPRIDPSRFTTQQFLDAIHQSTPWLQEPRVEFIWVDVACLDQNQGSLVSDSERGRQVAIFSKAARAFAWIHSIPCRQMEKMYSTITDLTHDLQMSSSSESSFQTHIQNSCQMLGIFLSDPWFSSLWTLQEAFLRHDALFLSKEGSRVSRLSTDGSSVEFTFRHLTLLEMCMRKTRKHIPHSAVQSWKTILDMMNTTGISAIGSLNSVAAYVAAKDRTTTRDEDRVYGIQQLFNFRLGSTAPGGAGTYWTISQLEDLLAEKLLEQYPT
ncbi:hypothetical protein EV127DRAFT_422829 [Xylaria flabelliformis]|nr:hypothetical protein EV127DRAFT_422829 [Xylaria flabelliformis]